MLLVGIYNPCNSLIKQHLAKLSSYIDILGNGYDNIVVIGNFNSEPIENELKVFCNIYGFKNLIHEPTCFKNILNPKCIDLILTNRPKHFQNSLTFETGISDFHKMIITIMKVKFKKMPPKVITYRNYKTFSQDNFKLDLNELLNDDNLFNLSNDEFVTLTMKPVNRHAPLKQKYLRANQAPFMTKELQKAFMLRTKLRNKSLKLKTEASYNEYKQQRNICTFLVRKAKRDYYSNLDPAKICDNKKFWSTVKPLFSDKSIKNSNIILIENNDIIHNDVIVAQKFNDFFSNVVHNLNIKMDSDNVIVNCNDTDPITFAIHKYKKHPSIIKIQESQRNVESKPLYSFTRTSYESIYKEILSIDPSKSSPNNSIPIKIIKENCDLFARKLHIDFNNSIYNGTFPNNLKLADVTPVYKKVDRTDKNNYRPVSILSPISKIYERLLFYQMYNYIESHLSNYQCGFRKGYSAQYCLLLLLLEKWRISSDNKQSSGILLTDLSKAVDCLSYDLLIAKLNAYGFNYKSLQLIYSYLTNRYQRVRINSSYSTWSEIINGVPQGSILGPMLFNIYLSDLFLFTNDSDIANYADDNSPYATGTNMNSVMEKLENDSKALLKWVSNNSLKANPDKFHLLLNSNNNLSIKVDEFLIGNSKNEKLLGITLDNDLNFNEHVNKLCKKASQKLHALGRISKYMNIDQRRKIMTAFIHSQFGYCPLVWMFHSRTLNNQINRIHERALRIVYNDTHSTFNELLSKDGSFTIHERNIQTLAIELYKIIMGLSPQIMTEILPLKERNNYCSRFPFKSHNVKTVNYGTETISFLGPKIWSIIPNNIRNSSTLLEFKRNIKRWKPSNCPCRLCKIYIAGVGFIDGIKDTPISSIVKTLV